MITQAELKELLHYDPDTGIFTWKVTLGSRAISGDVAGSISLRENGKKYIFIRINKKTYRAHRLAFLYMTGSFPVNEVDHQNGSGVDNYWINLRQVPRSENRKNLRLQSTNASGTTGVSFNKKKKKWISQIQIDGKYKYIGTFINIEDAISARQKANIEHGFHANHGQDRPL